MSPFHSRPGRLAGAVVAAALLATACGSDDDPATPGGTSEESVPTSADDGDATTTAGDDPGSSTTGGDDPGSSTTALIRPDPTRGTDPDRQAPPPGIDEEATAEDVIAGLRERLGVSKVVIRVGDALASDNGTERFELPADYAEVHPGHLVTATRIFDDAGRPVCPDLRLGDFAVIVEVARSDDGSTVVTLENRRALVVDQGPGAAPIGRWAYDCGSGERTELEASAWATWDGDVVVELRARELGPVLETEWGLGDSPAVIRNGGGAELVGFDDLAFDHHLSPDAATLYFTSFSGTGAAEPPTAVAAVDTTTGAERWRIDEPGFVHVAGDRVIVEVVDTSAINDLGQFDTVRLLVVDAATGEVLDDVPFAGDLVGVT